MNNGSFYFQHEYANSRHKEKLATAENIRLLNLATQNQKDATIQHHRLDQQAWLKLGQLLVIWGINLQKHYIQTDTPALAAYLEHSPSE